jgi:hypothetical protein
MLLGPPVYKAVRRQRKVEDNKQENEKRGASGLQPWSTGLILFDAGTFLLYPEAFD